MIQPDTFKDTLFNRATVDFNGTALELFQYQAVHCEPYATFLSALNIAPSSIRHWRDIPCLPIETFKKHEVKSGAFEPAVTFTSSGTTGAQTSRHFVKSMDWYHRVFKEAFRLTYGPAKEFRWLCLLPSYLEREGSSLIEMAKTFIDESQYSDSNFFLRNHDELRSILSADDAEEIPTILLGVSFGLLDFAEEQDFRLPKSVILMETGGMKGRRVEMIRSELHEELSKRLHVTFVHSEYGMTEMMSQAYSTGLGEYTAPPWMRVGLRDPADPLSKSAPGKTGGINVIDLANVDSCAFLATQDLGKTEDGTTFQVMGRFDDSDIRGCNLMVQ